MEKIIPLLFFVITCKLATAQFIEYNPIEYNPTINSHNTSKYLNAIDAKNKECYDFIIELQSQILDIKSKTTDAGYSRILDTYYKKLDFYKMMRLLYKLICL